MRNQNKQYLLTKTGQVYHFRTGGDSPLNELLVGDLGKTNCGKIVTRVLGTTTSPSPLSAHATVRAAIKAGLYCGNCDRRLED